MITQSKKADKTSAALFLQLDKLLLEEHTPSFKLRELIRMPEFSTWPMTLLQKLDATPQSPVHHPEGNVWEHTLRVVDEAAKRRSESCDPQAFMWAALLHDVGKPQTTHIYKGRITAYEHDKVGAVLAGDFLEALTEDHVFIDRVSNLVRYHMQILYVVNDLPFKDISGMMRSGHLSEIALLSLCDRLGREGASRQAEEAQVKRFKELCQKI